MFDANHPDQFTIFLHIHKCAGLSFKRLLNRKHRSSIFKRLAGKVRRNRPQPLLAALAAADPQDGYFAGHFGFGVHQLLPKPSRYVTFLRKPVKRLISLYEYSRATPAAFYHKHARGRTFHEFVTCGAVHEADNGMLRFLLGETERINYYVCREPAGSLTQDHLDQAIEHLETHFVTPGLTERFDESLLLLQRELSLPSIHYLKVNERAASAKVGTQWEPDLEPHVALDRQLYAWAEKRLDDRIRQHLAEAPSALRDFQQLNAEYQKRMQNPYEVYQTIRQKWFGKAA